jgi:hypothetical protein
MRICTSSATGFGSESSIIGKTIAAASASASHRSDGGAHVFSGSSGSSCVLLFTGTVHGLFPALTGSILSSSERERNSPLSDRSDALSLFV